MSLIAASGLASNAITLSGKAYFLVDKISGFWIVQIDRGGCFADPDWELLKLKINNLVNAIIS